MENEMSNEEIYVDVTPAGSVFVSIAAGQFRYLKPEAATELARKLVEAARAANPATCATQKRSYMDQLRDQDYAKGRRAVDGVR
jgi:hypothetical protein